MTMKVHKPSYYDGRFPQFNLPLEIGCFSIDGKGKFHNDEREMKYLSMPEKMSGLSMDLNEGFHKFFYELDHSDYSYNALLKWIVSNQRIVKKQFMDRFSSSPKVDFVLWRGPFNALSSTLYEKWEDWLIHATKIRSTIYLVLSETERRTKEVEIATEKQKRMMTWGLKFEQYMVSDTENSKPDTSVPVNQNEKYIPVFKGKLGNHSLLFSAEVDGVDPEHFTAVGCDPKSPLRYIELKTTRIISSSKQRRNFCRHKLLKWYLQSFFLGIPRVICGFRDDEGVVGELKNFNVRDMPKLAKGLWSPAACLNFVSRFLDHVKQCVVKDDIVYEFYWEPGSDVITCEELDEEEASLPKWYKKQVRVI